MSRKPHKVSLVSLDRESRELPIVPSSLEAFDLQAANIFEMPAIVSAQGQIVPESHDANPEIEIRNALSLGAYSASLLSEPLGGRFIDDEDGHVTGQDFE